MKCISGYLGHFRLRMTSSCDFRYRLSLFRTLALCINFLGAQKVFSHLLSEICRGNKLSEFIWGNVRQNVVQHPSNLYLLSSKRNTKFSYKKQQVVIASFDFATRLRPLK